MVVKLKKKKKPLLIGATLKLIPEKTKKKWVRKAKKKRGKV